MRKHVAADASDPLTPFEVQLISNDEQGLWAELHSRRLTFDGEPALLTFARDITHRKSLETSLGRGKLQARITLESIGEGVITTDRNGTIDYMNEAAEQLIGGTRSAGSRQAAARSPLARRRDRPQLARRSRGQVPE